MTACGAGDRQPDYTDELAEEETQINSQPDAPGEDEDGETQGNDRTDAAGEENPDNAAVPGNSVHHVENAAKAVRHISIASAYLNN